MNNQQILVETREFRTTEFSMLPIGCPFYQRRPSVGSENGKLIKTITEKTSNGAWANAKATYGLRAQFFIKYDSKVITEK